MQYGSLTTEGYGLSWITYSTLHGWFGPPPVPRASVVLSSAYWSGMVGMVGMVGMSIGYGSIEKFVPRTWL